MCEIHEESFNKSWADHDGSSDLAQPDKHPADSTAVSGSVAQVDYFNN